MNTQCAHAITRDEFMAFCAKMPDAFQKAVYAAHELAKDPKELAPMTVVDRLVKDYWDLDQTYWYLEYALWGAYYLSYINWNHPNGEPKTAQLPSAPAPMRCAHGYPTGRGICRAHECGGDWHE